MTITIQICILDGQVDSDVRTDHTHGGEMLLAADVLGTIQKNILRLVMQNDFNTTVKDEKTQILSKSSPPPQPKGK